jgi:predicted Rossmann fold flavoprotein
MSRIGIIGAGPAGIFAAIEARRKGGEVLLIDSNSQIGRKLLVTGSGRCNLSNTKVSSERYITQNRQFVEQALAVFGHPELIVYLNELGILTYSTEDGWIYPVSNSAANVVNILAAHLDDLKVEFHPNFAIRDFWKSNDNFILEGPPGAGNIEVERLVIASGGCSSPALGSTGEMFRLMEKEGHNIIPLRPALAPLEIDHQPFHKLQGVRMDLGLKIIKDKKVLGESTGNVIFTEWGVNGPGVMDLSHFAGLFEGNSLVLEINFLPYHASELMLLFEQFKTSTIPILAVLEMVLPPKVAALFITRCDLSSTNPVNDIPDNTIKKLFQDLTRASVIVKKTRGFEFAQISAGGIDVTEVNAKDMQSKKVKGLYFAGEILDVAGPCGGFNLQWAFTSGFIAGSHVGDF